VDFLLECIGFPPDMDREALMTLVRERGEPVAYRGPHGEHLRLALTEGLELRLDREEEQGPTNLLPYYREPSRLRVAVDKISRTADSPADALLLGWAAPPIPGDLDGGAPGAYRLTMWITDARRLPRHLTLGQVLAVSLAGFCLDTTFVGPNDGGCDASILERPHGFSFQVLKGEGVPGGCAELSARVKAVRHIQNTLTGRAVDVLEVDAPGRDLHLFVSPWQLSEESLPAPRPGFRIEGSFLFTGRLSGGLGRQRPAAQVAFG
jgi:hypothetical protein